MFWYTRAVIIIVGGKTGKSYYHPQVAWIPTHLRILEIVNYIIDVQYTRETRTFGYKVLLKLVFIQF